MFVLQEYHTVLVRKISLSLFKEDNPSSGE